MEVGVGVAVEGTRCPSRGAYSSRPSAPQATPPTPHPPHPPMTPTLLPHLPPSLLVLVLLVRHAPRL